MIVFYCSLACAFGYMWAFTGVLACLRAYDQWEEDEAEYHGSSYDGGINAFLPLGALIFGPFAMWHTYRKYLQ